MDKAKTVRSLIKFVIIAAIVAVLLFVALIVVLKKTWKPTEKDKTSFTASDISVIASELSVPEEGLDISEMRFSHAKDSVFVFKGSSSSSYFMDSFEFAGKKDYADNYKLKNKNETSCTIQKTDDGCNFEIILYEYNKKLLDIM